ncbi:MAG: tetratricopeptide repeat protein [Flavobacteriales bacterium]|nr:tetratricopeptide repeat protein [Flavobacteriales bacterium]MBK6752359.1 tetratricopeptide repeat protein [Flavobacteriales bacterium]MBK7268877.1 tetratricopeptide repeat protein [Flavobacteriales bacterium]MBK7752187.1 tetratricopeptide repeat protein [Flavobacteriales bacterium]MBK9074331.1 tetratricopeptide repeat protein [Flavobacteriales bacterium]
MSRILSTVLLGLSLSNGRAQDLALATSGDKALEETYTKGEQAYQRGAYEEAIALFSDVLKQDPEHLNAYLQRGFCQSLTKQYEKAIADFSAVIARKPDHLWAYTSRGSAYTKLQRYDKAIMDFDLVIGLDPKNEEAFNNRGWARKASGDAPGACKDWRTSQRMGNAEARIILTNNRCK